MRRNVIVVVILLLISVAVFGCSSSEKDDIAALKRLIRESDNKLTSYTGNITDSADRSVMLFLDKNDNLSASYTSSASGAMSRCVYCEVVIRPDSDFAELYAENRIIFQGVEKKVVYKAQWNIAEYKAGDSVDLEMSEICGYESVESVDELQSDILLANLTDGISTVLLESELNITLQDLGFLNY